MSISSSISGILNSTVTAGVNRAVTISANAIGNIAQNKFQAAMQQAIGGSLGGTVSSIAGKALSSTLNGALGSAFDSIGGAGGIGGAISGFVGKSLGGAGNIAGALANIPSLKLSADLGSIIPSAGRIAAAGLLETSGGNSSSATFGGNTDSEAPWEVTITGQFTDNNFNCVRFPYTPTVTFSETATYDSQKLTHSNYTSYSYQSSEVSDISVSGDFSVQTETDVIKMIQTIMFLRASTKMYFGKSDNAGSPPPLVKLNGYGGYFKDVTCAVTSFTHTLPPEVDYVGASGGAMFPTLSNITVVLRPVYSRKYVADNFDILDVAHVWGSKFL